MGVQRNMNRLLGWLVLLLFAFGAHAEIFTQNVPCCSPVTGTCGSGQCATFDEYSIAGAQYFCDSGHDQSNEQYSCYCSHDTCVNLNCQTQYCASSACAHPNPVSWCTVSCKTNYNCDATGCPQYTGAAYLASANPAAEYFCTTPIRTYYCGGHGDLYTTNANPFATTTDFSSIGCKCDCGYGNDIPGSADFSSCQPGSGDHYTHQLYCDNHGTGNANVHTFSVTDGGIYKDPSGNTVLAFCPSDTCVCIGQGYFTNACFAPISEGPYCINTQDANGNYIGWTGSRWYNTAYNRGWFMCSDSYRSAICNGNGDSAIFGPTAQISPRAATDGTASCTCDCGYSGQYCATATAHTCGLTATCQNPGTGALVTMSVGCEPSSGNGNGYSDANTILWCPSDTCTRFTTGGSPAAPYATCNAVNGVGYIGLTKATGPRHQNAWMYCTQSFRNLVCSGAGDTALASGYAWNAFPNNVQGMPVATCKCDNGYFNQNGGQCNLYVACPVPRPGRAPAGAGTCGFTGWNNATSQGYCQQNGVCQCLNGWNGAACDSLCPSTTTTHECSGLGTCDKLSNPIDYLVAGAWYSGYDAFLDHYTLNVAPLPTIATNLEKNIMAALYLRNPFASYTPRYNAQLQQACITGQTSTGTIDGCYQSMLQFFVGNASYAAFLTNNQYSGTNMVSLVTQMFVDYYGFLTASATWLQPTALPSYFASTNTAVRAQGLALFLSYEQFVDFSSSGFTATYPTFPSTTWRCNCNRTKTANAPSGADCTGFCPTGGTGSTFLQACGGIQNGQPHGTCSSSSNTCNCARNYAGPACQLSLEGVCFNEATLGQSVVCSGASNGNCNITTVGTSTTAQCSCLSSWTGQFCSISRCSGDTTQCSNHGTCDAVVNNGVKSYQCDCTPQTSTNSAVMPPIWAGPLCANDAGSNCGFFVNNIAGGGGQWSVCSNISPVSGNKCLFNTTSNSFGCVCTAGRAGKYCQSETCSPACSSHQICNGATGQCSCQTMWGGTGCNTNLCGNGVPSVSGSTCICNPYYRTDAVGHCTITQCPLVYSTATGVRACNYSSDTNCTNPELGSPQSGCCWDACGSGSTSQCTVTNGQPTCGCDTTIYNQTNGICYSRCSGQPATVIGGHILCQCSGVSTGPNQWVDQTDCSVHSCYNGGHPASCGCQCNCISPPWSGSDCSISECENGGTSTSTGCSCPAAWGGQLCGVNQCQNGGTPFANGTGCSCPPRWHGPFCQINLCNNGGTPNAQGTACACPAPFNGPLCANTTCLNGGTPSNGKCVCHAPWTGIDCGTNPCLNGGTPGNGICNCVYPYVGSVCASNLCDNGGQPAPPKCTCSAYFNGTLCQQVIACANGGTFHANHTCTCPTVWGGDACQTSACLHGGVPSTNGQFCTSCPAAWTGTFCAISLCQNGGVPNNAGTACGCPFPYSGTLCASNQCANGGTPSGSVCQCPVPWTGSVCTTNACQHGGTASADGTRCSCVVGFSGTFCQNGLQVASTGSSGPATTTTLSTGAIVGIAVGGAAGVGGLATSLYFLIQAIRKPPLIVK